jgi:TRAP-type C4-dicarboxylate transport system substrate-binding protein
MSIGESKKMVAILAFLTGFALIILVGLPRHAYADPIVMKVAHFLPAHDITQRTAEVMGNWVEEKTQGRVKFEYYPAQTLAPAGKIVDATAAGICEIGWAVEGYHPGRFPRTEVVDLAPCILKAAVASKAYSNFYKKYLVEEWERQIKVLAFYVQPPMFFHTKTPIRRLSDLKGKRIRSYYGVRALFDSIGATLVSMPLSQAYEAVQKGIADGLICPSSQASSLRMYEVAPYHTLLYPAASSFAWIMNEKTYNSLPADIKQVFDQLGEWFPEKCGQLWDEDEVIGEKNIRSKNQDYITLPPEDMKIWFEKVKAVNEGWANKAEEKGIPGHKLLEAMQL